MRRSLSIWRPAAVAMALSVLVVGLCLAGPARGVPLSPERRARLQTGRALWVKRDQLTSPERIMRCVDDAADAGYKVLFVQVRGRGDAWYVSDIEPAATLIANARLDDGRPFDPLDLILRRAHARGLEVHAWLNALLVWSGDGEPDDPDHILNRHRDWACVDSDGRSLAEYSPYDIKRANIEGVFLSAGNPLVRRYVRSVVQELALHYPVDGVHLDYIRCPLVDTGYDAASRAAFMAECGVDPWKLRHGTEALRQRYGLDGVASLEEAWKSWKAAQVTRLVADIHADLARIGKPILLSAAVFPNCDSAPVDVGQDWMTWCRKGYLDVVVPMMYSRSTEVVMHQLALAQRDLPADVMLYAGIAVYNQSLESAADKAVHCLSAGAQGVCFFPYDTLAQHPGALRALTRMAFGRMGGGGAARLMSVRDDVPGQ